jgi:hypothetical protein
MGHLFYAELGGIAGFPLSSSSDPDLAFFTNIQSGFYWFGTPTVMVGSDRVDEVYGFTFHGGIQGRTGPTASSFAWAVRDGDVLQEPRSLPEPSTLTLINMGLVGLWWSYKQTKRRVG